MLKKLFNKIKFNLVLKRYVNFKKLQFRELFLNVIINFNDIGLLLHRLDEANILTKYIYFVFTILGLSSIKKQSELIIINDNLYKKIQFNYAGFLFSVKNQILNKKYSINIFKKLDLKSIVNITVSKQNYLKIKYIIKRIIKKLRQRSLFKTISVLNSKIQVFSGYFA
jgi:hypothetical protein